MLNNKPLTKKRLLHFENSVQTWLVEDENSLPLILKVATSANSNALVEKEIWCLQNIQPMGEQILVKTHGEDEQGYAYFVRDYLPVVLSDKLEGDEILTLEFVSNLAIQLFTQLAQLHAKGFIYIDTKPDNLLIATDGNVVLSDYGSCIAYTEQSKSTVEQLPFWSQLIFTSDEFLHPKFNEHRSNIGPWIDIYAAGKTIEKLSEKLPSNQGMRLQTIIQKCIDVDVFRSEGTINDVIKSTEKILIDYSKQATKHMQLDESLLPPTVKNEKVNKRLVYFSLFFFALLSVLLITAVISNDPQENSVVSGESNEDNSVPDTPVDIETLFQPSESTSSIDDDILEQIEDETASLRELLYRGESGEYIRIPFVRKSIDGKVIWVSQQEVDNQLYGACIRTGLCSSNKVISTRESRKRLNDADMPAVNLSWVMIEQEFLPFAQSEFGLPIRLMTLKEWQNLSLPARNDIIDGLHSMHCKSCGYISVYNENSALPVNAMQPDSSGLVNIYGNVREWLGGCAVDSAGIERCYQAFVAGGSWRNEYREIMKEPLSVLQKRARSIDTGFRLVFDD